MQLHGMALQLPKAPGFFNRARHLIGDPRQQPHLILRVHIGLAGSHIDNAQYFTPRHQRNRQNGLVLALVHFGKKDKAVILIRFVADHDRLALAGDPTRDALSHF